MEAHDAFDASRDLVSRATSSARMCVLRVSVTRSTHAQSFGPAVAGFVSGGLIPYFERPRSYLATTLSAGVDRRFIGCVGRTHFTDSVPRGGMHAAILCGFFQRCPISGPLHSRLSAPCRLGRRFSEP